MSDEPKTITLDDLRSMNLSVIDGEINKKRLELAFLEDEIAAMEQVYKVVDMLQNGKPPRKPRVYKNRPASSSAAPAGKISPFDGQPKGKGGRKSRAEMVYRTVLQHVEIHKRDIARILKCDESDVMFTLENGWNGHQFDMDDDGKWFLKVDDE